MITNLVAGKAHLDQTQAKPRILRNQQNKLFFRPESAPHSQHRLINDRELVNEVLYLSLIQHLSFTKQLEIQVVNPVVARIAQHELEVDLPREMRLGAYRIYQEEGDHAYSYANFQYQLEKATGKRPICGDEPRFLRRLRSLQDSVPPEYSQLIKVPFVIVSETLISDLLNQTPHDERIVDSVRKLISDHAIDETRHRTYFSRFLEFFWRQMNQEQKIFIGNRLPELIHIFLEPDYLAIKNSLSHLGLTPQEIQRVLEESYSSQKINEEIRKAANQTLSVFERNEILEIPQIKEAFIASELIEF